MSWLRFLRRAGRDAECARELESYLAIETDDNIARGMPPVAARAAALRKLGNATRVREEIYDMHTIGPLDSVWQDLRHAVRVLTREKAFAAAAILSGRFAARRLRATQQAIGGDDMVIPSTAVDDDEVIAIGIENIEVAPNASHLGARPGRHLLVEDPVAEGLRRFYLGGALGQPDLHLAGDQLDRQALLKSRQSHLPKRPPFLLS